MSGRRSRLLAHGQARARRHAQRRTRSRLEVSTASQEAIRTLPQSLLFFRPSMLRLSEIYGGLLAGPRTAVQLRPLTWHQHPTPQEDPPCPELGSCPVHGRTRQPLFSKLPIRHPSLSTPLPHRQSPDLCSCASDPFLCALVRSLSPLVALPKPRAEHARVSDLCQCACSAPPYSRWSQRASAKPAARRLLT